MRVILSGSAADRMPSLNNMPMAVIHSLLQLEKLPCIYVIDSFQRYGHVLLQIAFNNNTPPRYREALNCFRGLKPRGFKLNGRHRLMELTVSTITAVV